MGYYWIRCAGRKTKQTQAKQRNKNAHDRDHAVLQEIYLHELHRRWVTIASMFRQLLTSDSRFILSYIHHF